jgi:hypothetical protein
MRVRSEVRCKAEGYSEAGKRQVKQREMEGGVLRYLLCERM